MRVKRPAARTSVTIALLFVALTAGAGADDARAPSPRTTTQSPAMTKLLRLVGEWSGTAEGPATPHRPEWSSPADASIRPILGGRHLEAVLRYRVAEQPYEGRLIVSDEPHDRRYSATWLDSMVAGSIRFRGTLDPGGSLVLVGERRQNGQVVRERLQITPLELDRLEIRSSSNALGDMTVGVVIRAARTRSP
jgi:hypothetical protein